MVFELPRVVLLRRLGWKGFDTQRATDVTRVEAQSMLDSLTLSAADDNQLEVFHGH